MPADADNAPAGPLRTPAWIAAAIVVAGVALNLGSLGQGLALDDRIYTSLLAKKLDGSWDVPWYEVASMMNPRGSDGIAALIDAGRLPWWSDPQLRWALFRPLALLAHYADMALWPAAPLFMHAQNLLWYGGLLAALWWLYARTLGAGAAGLLALACYALSASHGQVVAWLASRNSMMFVVFSVLALSAHDRARRRAKWAGRFTVLSVLCLLLGLLCSEGAVAVWAYLLAHAVWVDRGSPRARLRSLLPAAGVTLVWQLAYRAAGFGTENSGVYLDPLTEPEAFLEAVPPRLWLMLRELLGLPLSLEAAPPHPAWAGTLVTAIVLALLLGSALFPGRRLDLQAEQGRVLRFYLAGALGSLLPLCAAHVSYRMLLLPAVGTCGALGLVLTRLLLRCGALRTAWRGVRGLLRRGGGVLALVLLTLRLPVGAAMMPMAGRTHLALDAALVRYAQQLPAALPGRTTIVLNTPYYLVTMFALYLRAGADPSRTGFAYVLGAHAGPVVLSRPAHHSLRLQPAGGYLTELSSLVARTPRHPFVVGQRIAMGPVQVTVEALTDDGRPSSVRYDFDDIDDPGIVWSDTTAHGFEFFAAPVTLPAVGQSVVLQPSAQ